MYPINILLEQAIAEIPKQIRKKGFELYLFAMADLIDEDTALQEYHFEVEGDDFESFYDVDVFFYEDNPDGQFYCTCDYAETKIYCEHIAASLFLLQEKYPSPQKNLFNNLSKVATAKSKNGNKQPFKIEFPSSGNADPKVILKDLLSKTNMNGLQFDHAFLLPNQLQISFKNTWNFLDQMVTVDLKEGALYIACNEPSHKGICEHIGAAVRFIAFHKNQSILETIDAEKQKQIRLSFLEDQGYNVNGNNLEELIKIYVNQNNIYLRATGKINGLFRRMVKKNFKTVQICRCRKR